MAMKCGICQRKTIAKSVHPPIETLPPAFVASTYFGMAVPLTLTGEDGGMRNLEALDGGPQWMTLYAPGPIARGDLFTLAIDAGPSCGRSTAAVSVIDAAPFPTDLGTISFGPPAGFLRPGGGTNGDCTPEFQVPAAQRAVSVIFPDEVLPWVSVMRVKVNGADADYGHLSRSVTPGTPTLIGQLVTDCGVSRGVHRQGIAVVLEIAGRAEVIRVDSTVDIDCSVAPPAPAAGCNVMPGTMLVLLAVWLRARRSGSCARGAG